MDDVAKRREQLLAYYQTTRTPRAISKGRHPPIQAWYVTSTVAGRRQSAGALCQPAILGPGPPARREVATIPTIHPPVGSATSPLQRRLHSAFRTVRGRRRQALDCKELGLLPTNLW